MSTLHHLQVHEGRRRRDPATLLTTDEPQPPQPLDDRRFLRVTIGVGVTVWVAVGSAVVIWIA